MKKILSAFLTLISCSTIASPIGIEENNIRKAPNEKINICGKVTGSKGPGSNVSKSTIISVSDAENTSTINVVIRQEDRKNFSYKPEEFLYNKNVCVTGIFADFNGRTDLFIRRPEEIKVDESAGNNEMRPFDLDIFNRFMQDED